MKVLSFYAIQSLKKLQNKSDVFACIDSPYGTLRYDKHNTDSDAPAFTVDKRIELINIFGDRGFYYFIYPYKNNGVLLIPSTE